MNSDLLSKITEVGPSFISSWAYEVMDGLPADIVTYLPAIIVIGLIVLGLVKKLFHLVGIAALVGVLWFFFW